MKHIVENESLNLSKWVNDNLEHYFSVSTIEEVDKKLSTARDKVSILEQKRAALVSEGFSETVEEALNVDYLATLRSNYKVRCDAGQAAEGDAGWIRSPRNLERLRALGKEPEVMLKELKGWYDADKKDND